jgi:hypothetical protein
MAGVITGAVISAGAGLIGSANSARASREASDAQREAAEQANVIAANAAENQIATLRDGLNRGILTQQQYLDKQNEIIGGISEEQKTLLADRLKFAEGIYTQQRSDYQPYRESGVAATNQLNTLLGIGGNTGAANYGKYSSAEFTPADFAAGKDPGYGFRMSEGLKAVDRQAAARGGLISGNALKASQAFGQEAASQEYQNAFNRFQTMRGNTLSPFASLSGQGLNAASLTGQAGAQYGAAGQQAYGDYGTSLNNRQASALGATGAASQGISGMYGNYGNASATAYGNYATNATNALTGGANAQAAGIIGGANAFNQGVSGISNLANTYYLNKLLQGRNEGGIPMNQAQGGFNSGYEANAGVNFAGPGIYG